MENENKTKKTEQRVVLNLSMDQARGMIDLLDLALNETIQTPRRELGMTLKKRIQKTITKHENSEKQYDEAIKATSCTDCGCDIEHCTCRNQEPGESEQ